MELTTTKITELSLDPSNVRKHGRKNLDAIKASLRKFGQQKPIVVDAKGIVLAGNGTLAAAQELGWQEIDVVRSELAGVEATAFAIADNRTAELAEWKQELNEALGNLIAQNVDLNDLGFDRDYVKELQKKIEINEVEIKRPPKQAWFLIQLPFADLAAVQSALDNLPETTKTFSTFTD